MFQLVVTSAFVKLLSLAALSQDVLQIATTLLSDPNIALHSFGYVTTGPSKQVERQPGQLLRNRLHPSSRGINI